ncbi:MAG: YbaB/EbfC family nucleoid-associated protein [Candidatus Omnitrophota bacterium]
MFDKMKQMMEFKRQADLIKKELDALRLEVRDIPGIKIMINGAQEFQSIELDEQWLKSNDRKRLESDLLRSLNAAIKKSQNSAAEKMKGVLPGMAGW